MAKNRLTIENEFQKLCEELGLHTVNLQSKPVLFQTFLASVPDFFIERQGSPAARDEAVHIIASKPPLVKSNDKFLIGVLSNNKLIAFFEIILNFPTHEMLINEDINTKILLGQLEEPRFTIGFLVIHPDLRNQGLGSKLVAIIEKVLSQRGYQFSHLIVNQSNSKATSFYIRHHYQIVKETTQFIHNKKKSCFIMMKKLSIS